MAAERKEANLRMLAETRDIQDKTKDAVSRIQKQALETEEIGAMTLEELRKQGEQMEQITTEIDAVSDKLDQTQKLQDTFDVWSGGIFGFGKRKAQKAAQAEIALKAQEELMKVKEVFEQETRSMVSSTWKPYNMVLCSNTSVVAPDLFVPATQSSIPNSPWRVDMSLSGIDTDGWTYSTSFAALDKVFLGTQIFLHRLF